MKNNKLLMVGVLGLAFGVFSRVEAFYFCLGNSTAYPISFKLYKHNPALPKAVVSNPVVLAEYTGIPAGKMIEREVSNAKSVRLVIEFQTKGVPRNTTHTATYVINRLTEASEPAIIVNFDELGQLKRGAQYGKSNTVIQDNIIEVDMK